MIERRLWTMKYGHWSRTIHGRSRSCQVAKGQLGRSGSSKRKGTVMDKSWDIRHDWLQRATLNGYGVDYEETYAPVVRYTTIRLLMGIAAHRGLKIHQTDAVTAFLQGDLDEEIYLGQPKGFNNGSEKSLSIKPCNIWAQASGPPMERKIGPKAEGNRTKQVHDGSMCILHPRSKSYCHHLCGWLSHFLQKCWRIMENSTSIVHQLQDEGHGTGQGLRWNTHKAIDKWHRIGPGSLHGSCPQALWHGKL